VFSSSRRGPRYPEVTIMKALPRWILPFPLVLAIALPATARAQGHGNDQHEDKGKNKHVGIFDRDDDDDDWKDHRRSARDRIVLRDRGRTIILFADDLFWFPVRSDSGPSFCRSGAGHPVWGLQWCLDKGFGIGRHGSWFLRGDDLFLRDRNRVIVVRDRAGDADRLFWSAVVGQLLAWAD
jgi:hypothetical protein